MNKNIVNRVYNEAIYILKTKKTVREIAKSLMLVKVLYIKIYKKDFMILIRIYI